MTRKRPIRKRRRLAPRSVGDVRIELAAVVAKCAENASRIDRLELDHTTQVRRCAELQSDIDRLKNDRASRLDR